MERQTLVFVTERETKNSVRFQEETNGSEPPAVGDRRYRQVSALGDAVCAALGARRTLAAAVDRDD